MRWQLEVKIRAFENMGKLTTVIAGSSTLAMAGTIVAEFIAANQGIGHSIRIALYQSDLSRILTALGADFLINTTTARYRQDDVEATAFLSDQGSDDAASKALSSYASYIQRYGSVAGRTDVQGVSLLAGDMGGAFDVVFQSGDEGFIIMQALVMGLILAVIGIVLGMVGGLISALLAAALRRVRGGGGPAAPPAVS